MSQPPFPHIAFFTDLALHYFIIYSFGDSYSLSLSLLIVHLVLAIKEEVYKTYFLLFYLAM